jgi:class 3 adenylate cyclase
VGWSRFAFDDARLEADFRGEFAVVAQRRHLQKWRLTALMNVVLGLSDLLVVPPDRLHGCLLVRYGAMVPFCLVVGLFARVSPSVYARWGERVVSFGRAGVFALCAAFAVVASPLRWPTTQYLVMLVALLVVIQHSNGLARIGWNVVATTIGSGLVLVALLLGGASTSELAYAVFFLTLANGAGASISRTLEGHRRREFAQQRTIAEERAKSERLLANMLPEPIAERLKRKPQAIADGFEAVSVLFADIVGFTRLSATMQPHALVELLNRVFSRFDELARVHGLEKIKTIGDSYMAVAGLPSPQEDHARAAAEMALAMREEIGRVSDGKLVLRIGLHAGPVVAGVIGVWKYSYDLWGDTVNTASRMESHGAPGAIHASAEFRAFAGDGFVWEERGAIDIKGKEPMLTFWLAGRRIQATPSEAAT